MTDPAWFIEAEVHASPAVLAAMRAIDRRAFIAADFHLEADRDTPVPTCHGQTISQPSLVAQMLTALQLEAGMRVLDIGAGSGYVSALLAHLVGSTGHVVAIERQGDLIVRARSVLNRLAPAIDLRHGDGLHLLADCPQFDRIHVGCACDRIPRAWKDRLAEGGLMMVPVGPLCADQDLTMIRRQGQRWEASVVATVRFVPALPGIIPASAE